MEKVKSPVNIINFQKPHQDIFINKYTKITPLPIDEIDFPHAEICNKDGLILIMSSLQKVAGEQIVSLKAEVAELSGIKYLDTVHHGKLRKQEAILRDTTSSTKVVLWGDYVGSLELNKTYLLRNLRVKVTKTDRYLNTAKTEKFTYTETEPFTRPLVDVAEELSVITSMTWTGRILGIQQVVKTPSCRSCGKTVNERANGVLGECSSYKMSQVLSSCPAHWFLKALVENVNKTEEKLKLSFYPNDVKQFVEKLGITIDLDEAKEDDILIEILLAQKNISVTCKVTNIEL